MSMENQMMKNLRMERTANRMKRMRWKEISQSKVFLL